MKIYITNIPPSTIKLTNIEKHLINKEGTKKYEIVSEEFGTHIIEQKQNKINIYRIEPTLNMDLHLINDFNGYNLLVDKTKYVHIPVVSQLPVDYVITKITAFEYAINKQLNSKISSGLKLIVDCLTEIDTATLEKEKIPINFYFSYDEKNSLDIDENLLEEINMFLSDLN
jgi:hypothetical protein